MTDDLRKARGGVMSELRDCPFCGGPAHLVIGDEFCHIRCHQCGATGALADAIRESDAIATWNRRPETPASGESDSGLVERLREHATDWDGKQMPDLEPAKNDPTAGTLREAADRIDQQAAEIRRLKEEKAALLIDVKSSQAMQWELVARAEQAEVDRAGYLAIAESRVAQINKAKAALSASEARVKEMLEALPFIQRVLESDAPKGDREKAAQMVRNLRRAALKGE